MDAHLGELANRPHVHGTVAGDLLVTQAELEGTRGGSLRPTHERLKETQTQTLTQTGIHMDLDIVTDMAWRWRWR